MNKTMHRHEVDVGIQTARVRVYMHEQAVPAGGIPSGWHATRTEAAEAAIRQMHALAEALSLHAYELRVGTTRGEGT